MPDTNRNQPKQLFLLLLIFLFIVIICVQAWRMLIMEQQLNALDSDKLTLQLPIKASVTSTEETTEIATTNSAESDNQQSSNATEDPIEQTAPNDDDFSEQPFNPWTTNPYADIRRMQQNMDFIFNDIERHWNDRPIYEHHFRQHISAPKIKIREDGNRYRILVTIPGIDAHDISVNLKGQRLTISAKQDYQNESRNEAGNFTFRERRSGRFQRSVMLREPVNPNAIKTRIDNGVLMIMIPKARY